MPWFFIVALLYIREFAFKIPIVCFALFYCFILIESIHFPFHPIRLDQDKIDCTVHLPYAE